MPARGRLDRSFGRSGLARVRAGGVAHANRVGHAFFKTRMRDEGAIFGGEVSGHYYFRDFYNADSGTIPALLILELLSVEGKRMTELLELAPNARVLEIGAGSGLFGFRAGSDQPANGIGRLRTLLD